MNRRLKTVNNVQQMLKRMFTPYRSARVQAYLAVRRQRDLIRVAEQLLEQARKTH